MEPVTIQCSTCQSRIRVRNASLMGKLANCPKCNSLIMVSAPQQIRVENPGRNPVDSMAVTRDGIDPNLGSTSALPDAYGPPDAQRMRPNEEEDYRLAAEPTDAPPLQTDAFHGDEFPGGPASSVSWQPNDQPLIPSDEWTSAGTTKKRQYLLVGFLGASGVVLALVMFMAFQRWYGGASAPLDQATVALAGGTEPPPPAQVGSQDIEDLPPEPNLPLLSSLTAEGGLPRETDNSLTPSPLTPALPDSLNPVVVNPPVADPSPTDIATAALDSAPPPAPSTKDMLPNARLMEIAPMLEWVVQPTIPDTGLIPSSPPLSAEDLGLKPASDSKAIPPIDWHEHSMKRLPGLKLGENLPLSQAINIWTHVSGVPSIVDLDSLAAADLDPNAPLSMLFQNMSIAQAAEEIANKSGMVSAEKENRYLEFRAAPEVLKEKLPASVSVAELIDGENGGEWLLSAMEQLFPSTQGGWSVQEGLLTCDQQRVDLMTWFRALRLLEDWRAARGLPTQLELHSAGRVASHFVDPTQLDFLDKDATEISSQARPVGLVLSRVLAQEGVACWIDWPNVGEGGLGPMSTYLAITNARPLRHVLADYADQFSLVVAIEDETTLWITSPRAYRAQPRLYVIASQGRTPEQWQQQLRPLTPGDENGIGQVQVIPTPSGDFIFLRCCRPVIKG